MNFEKDLETLEKIVEKLESDTLGIEESLALYNEAIALGKKCAVAIKESKGKLELLNADLSRINLDGDVEE